MYAFESQRLLEQAVGRMLVGRISGTCLDEKTRKLLLDGTAGGICIFKDNVENLEGLAELIADINSASPFNPIICVDQEGGAVQRFDQVISPLPSLMALAATGNEKHAETAAMVNGRQLRALGVNCALSPVIDVASNPLNPIIGTRAFSSDPQKVTQFAKAMIETFKQEGVIPVVKHYPGHGDTGQDSHSELAVIDRSRESIEKLELLPFKNCAQIAPALLAGHIWLTSFEKDPLPATLSKKLITDLLRHELEFEGVVFTDDMMMKAISGRYGISESALLTIEAGCDVVLLCCSPDELAEAHRFIVDAARSERISFDRIDEANIRIDNHFGFFHKLKTDASSRLAQLRTWIEDDNARISSIYQDAVCLLKGKMPSVNEAPLLVVCPNHSRYPLPFAKSLREQLKRIGIVPSIEELRYSANPDSSEIENIASAATGKNVAFVSFRAGLNPGQMDLARNMEKCASAFFGVAADSPYDCLAVSESASYLCTFDPSDKAIEELAIMLVLSKTAKGQCPVVLEEKQPSA